MKKLIEDYEKTYESIVCRIQQLKAEYRTKKEILRTKERECLIARIDTLEQERFEICNTLHELRKHQ